MTVIDKKGRGQELLPDAINALLDVIPVGENSRVNLEVSGKRPRLIHYNIASAEMRQRLIEQWQHIVSAASNFTGISRGADKTSSANLNAVGQRFYADGINIGRLLYSSYLSEEVHGYLTSNIDQGALIRLWLTTEGDDAIVPWELMHNGDDYLCLRLPFARTVSHLATEETRDVFPSGLLVVGSTGEGTLSHVGSEIEAIRTGLENSKLLKGKVNLRVLLTPYATKESVISELETGQYQVLHFAGHSVHEKTEPHLSYLLMDGGRRILADELARLSLAGKVRVVLLNSCASGSFSNSGANTIGLVHAFAAAGVPYAIGMAWEISDRGGMVLAKEFYEQFFTSFDPVESLRIARVKTGTAFDWNDPAWAAPVLYAPLTKQTTKYETGLGGIIRASQPFTTLFDARSKFFGLLDEFSETKTMNEMNTIAVSGGSIFSLVNEYVERSKRIPNLHIRVLLINPNEKLFDRAAPHWRQECSYYMKQALPQFNRRFQDSERKVWFEWRTYDFLPCVQGIMLERRYLLLSWFEWVKVGNKKELRGAERPFLYLEQGEENAEQFFSLFNGWFDYAWDK